MKQCFSNLGPEMFITKDTKRHLLCCCHDNNFAAGPILIKTSIPSFCLNQGPSTPGNLMVTVKTIWLYVCYKQEPLSYFKGLKMRTFGFWQKETGAKRVSMTMTLWLSFSFFCDEHFWCQFWRSLLLYFQRYCLFSILQF